MPNGGDNLVAYTRVSTLAKALDDSTQLGKWWARKTAEGLVKRPDLLTRVAGILANYDVDASRDGKRELNAVCEAAQEAAGSSRGREAGTGFHALTEAVDRGESPLVLAQDQARMDAYRAATWDAGYRPIMGEVFVVNDHVRAAGTFDRLWLCPDGRTRVGDLKTGKSEADYPLATTTQIAIYAHGLRYDPATHIRRPIDEHLDTTTGLLIHMPPSGGCTVVPLDLEKGWHAAVVADLIHHTIRKWKPADLRR
jgi:hypothetical protein